MGFFLILKAILTDLLGVPNLITHMAAPLVQDNLKEEMLQLEDPNQKQK
jgi:hypothetical protein